MNSKKNSIIFTLKYPGLQEYFNFNHFLNLFYRPKSVKIIYDGRINQTPNSMNISQNRVNYHNSKEQTIELKEINQGIFNNSFQKY